MNFTKKKMDRAFQWAGEKMGHDTRTNQTDEFKSLETEIALRHDGKCHLPYLAGHMDDVCCVLVSLTMGWGNNSARAQAWTVCIAP